MLLLQGTLFSWQHIRSVIRSRALDCRKTVRLGGPAHDADVHTLNGGQQRLLGFERSPRPLVVVFGSCS